MAGNEETEREMRNDMQHRFLAGCDLWMLQFMDGASSPTSKEQKNWALSLLVDVCLETSIVSEAVGEWRSTVGWMQRERTIRCGEKRLIDGLKDRKTDEVVREMHWKRVWSCVCVCVLTGASIPQLCLCWTTLSYSLPLSLFFFHSVCKAFFFLLSLFPSSPALLERSWTGWKLQNFSADLESFNRGSWKNVYRRGT